jgi:hypothetical protein
MSDSPALARSLRIPIAEVLRRLAVGEPVRFLDARSQKALAATSLQVPGSVRIHPVLLRIDPTWEPRHLTVIYCA